MSRAARRAERPAGRVERWVTRLSASRLPLAAWLVLVAAGLGLLVAAMVPVGPEWLGITGAVTIASTYAWALAARTGGRPVLFGSLAAALGVVTALVDNDIMSSGAAVLTSSVAAVLGVMATVPARSYLAAARECVVAVVIASIGAMASIGFEPTIRVVRYEYASLALAVVGALVLVFRLGAGFHGMGRRGLIVVVVGAVLLALTLSYAELLRRYDSSGLIESLLDVVRWSRAELGAFPRPIEAVLGVPAIAYGCHMRARRRQGWWVLVFGVAATSAVATSLGNPAITLREVGLSVLYGLLVGLVIAWFVVRLDLALTGTRGRGRRVAEQASAVRPEPARTQALL